MTPDADQFAIGKVLYHLIYARGGAPQPLAEA
jgi:hypothetical protein